MPFVKVYDLDLFKLEVDFLYNKVMYEKEMESPYKKLYYLQSLSFLFEMICAVSNLYLNYSINNKDNVTAVKSKYFFPKIRRTLKVNTYSLESLCELRNRVAHNLYLVSTENYSDSVATIKIEKLDTLIRETCMKVKADMDDYMKLSVCLNILLVEHNL